MRPRILDVRRAHAIALSTDSLATTLARLRHAGCRVGSRYPSARDHSCWPATRDPPRRDAFAGATRAGVAGACAALASLRARAPPNAAERTAWRPKPACRSCPLLRDRG